MCLALGVLQRGTFPVNSRLQCGLASIQTGEHMLCHELLEPEDRKWWAILTQELPSEASAPCPVTDTVQEERYIPLVNIGRPTEATFTIPTWFPFKIFSKLKSDQIWIPFRLSDPEPPVKTKFNHFLLWGLREAKCLLLPSCVRRVSSRSMVAQPSSSFLSVWQLHSFRSKRLWGVTLLPGTKKETFDELHLTVECCLFTHVCLQTAFTTSGKYLNSHFILVKTPRFWTFCLHPLKKTKQSQQKRKDFYHLIDRIV